MAYAIFDIDGTLIDEIETANNVFRKNFEDSEFFSMTADKYIFCKIIPVLGGDRVKLIKPVASELRRLWELDVMPIFVTFRPKFINGFTKRQLEGILERLGMSECPIRLYNAVNKVIQYGYLYKGAYKWFEDSPAVFPRLWALNQNGTLVRHKYNMVLCDIYPCM